MCHMMPGMNTSRSTSLSVLATDDVTPWYLRPQPKSMKKIKCVSVPGAGWLVSCPCCGVDWSPTTGRHALQIVRAHADAHVRLKR